MKNVKIILKSSQVLKKSIGIKSNMFVIEYKHIRYGKSNK